MGIKFIDNRKKVIKEVEKAKQRALIDIGVKVEEQAVYLVPVRSGDLRNSIDYKTDKNFVYVGVLKSGPGADYAIIIEIGDKNRKAQSYIREAFLQRETEIKKIIQNHLKKMR